MGVRLSLEDAAQLVGRHERVIRRRIYTGDLRAVKDARGAWRIDADDLAAVPGWTLDRDRLVALERGQRRSPASQEARIEQLEAQVRRLERQVGAVVKALGLDPAAVSEALASQEARQAAQGYQSSGESAAPSYGLLSEPGGHSRVGLSDDARHILSDRPTARTRPATVALADRLGAPLAFKTKTDAARWLQRHGLSSEATPKTWRGWPPDELTPAAVLGFALALQQEARERGDWRVTWRLQRCGDDGCVCRTML